jgi:hypothetical protein
MRRKNHHDHWSKSFWMQEKCQFLIFTHLLHEYINSLKNRKCPYNIIQNFINPIVGQINIKMIYVGKWNENEGFK